jgi:hypothetical protein
MALRLLVLVLQVALRLLALLVLGTQTPPSSGSGNREAPQLQIIK